MAFFIGVVGVGMICTLEQIFNLSFKMSSIQRVERQINIAIKPGTAEQENITLAQQLLIAGHEHTLTKLPSFRAGEGILEG